MKRTELNQLARDIRNNLVFIDRMVRDYNDIRWVFLPIALGGLKEEDCDNIGMIYEYYRKAAPRGMNGYPMFFSMRTLNQRQTQYVLKRLRWMDRFEKFCRVLETDVLQWLKEKRHAK